MDAIKIGGDMNRHRRLLPGGAAATIAAVQIGRVTSASAQPGNTEPAPLSAGNPDASFGFLKQVDAGVLNAGYAEAGPASGPVVILLHGWPYDIHSYVDVAPLLASAGHRVIVPFLRGYGSTRFLSSDAFRNGQPSAIAADMVALMDALGIERATQALRLGRAPECRRATILSTPHRDHGAGAYQIGEV